MKHCIKIPIKIIAIVYLTAFISSFFCCCSSVNKDYFFDNSKSNININSKSLNIVFIDVGQADSILIMDSGKSMLIDGGNTDDSDLVCNKIKSYGIETIDYVVNTHAHEDHCGGLAKVVSTFSVNNAIISPKNADTDCYNDFISALNDKNITTHTAKTGESFSIGDAKAQIIGPFDDTANDENLNNTSVVIKLTYNSDTFLFMGDAENEEERSIIENGADVKCDLLKVGHHCSQTSSGYVFLRYAQPKFAVISVGKNNAYNHPDSNTLSRYKDLGTAVYRTDLIGTIIVSDEKNKDISINPEK